jgi:hypothetical protein
VRCYYCKYRGGGGKRRRRVLHKNLGGNDENLRFQAEAGRQGHGRRKKTSETGVFHIGENDRNTKQKRKYITKRLNVLRLGTLI